MDNIIPEDKFLLIIYEKISAVNFQKILINSINVIEILQSGNVYILFKNNNEMNIKESIIKNYEDLKEQILSL